MARNNALKTDILHAQLRVTGSVRNELQRLLFSRYPDEEWATFFSFGIRKTESGAVLTIVQLLSPTDGDLNPDVPHVEIQEPYSLRAALHLRNSNLCMGVVHSHPQRFGVSPSVIDDDMDAYYKEYFSGFGKLDCYFSLIFSLSEKGELVFSGRGWLGSDTYQLREIVSVSESRIERHSMNPKIVGGCFRTRLEQLYTKKAAERLANSTVAILGTSGTGSPAAHVLARAGIGRFILIEPQRLERSNLERIHGSYPQHFEQQPFPYKLEVVRDLIQKINPDAEVTCIAGNILQSMARDYAVTADILLCCTDTNHSRTAIGELAYRYLLPAIDVAVSFESSNGNITAEVGQVTLYAPGLPCAYCMSLVDSWRASVELMSPKERDSRREAARAAQLRGEDGGVYWKDLPELPTVGHFTTLAGSLAATYAIGWLTGKFMPPSNHFQFDILAKDFGYVGVQLESRENCVCKRLIGFSDQGAAETVISAPEHWPEAKLILR